MQHLSDIVDFAERIRRRSGNSRAFLWLLSAILVVAACAAWVYLEIKPELVRWSFIIWSALLVLPLLSTTAAEYWVLGRMNGLQISTQKCLEVSLTGTTLNLMPIPGQAAARVGDLVGRNISFGVATKTTLSIALLWCGWSFAAASIAAAVAGNALLMWASVTVAVITFASSILISDTEIPTLHWVTIGSGIEVINVVLTITRLWLVFVGLNLTIDISSVVILTTSNVAAALIGVFPGGLGLREAIAGIIASFLSIDPVSAMLAVGITRAIGLATQGCISALVAVNTR